MREYKRIATVTIKDPSGFAIISARDFDPSRHTLFIPDDVGEPTHDVTHDVTHDSLIVPDDRRVVGPRAKAVAIDGIAYPSIAMACEALGVDRASLTRRLNNSIDVQAVFAEG